MELTGGQKVTLLRISEFLNSEKSVFILKGYAGTGKTTLILELVRLLKRLGRSFSVMAPTGRAAKILREKTGVNGEDEYGETIHRSIYSFDDLYVSEVKNSSGLSMLYHFPVRILDSINHIFIIDESSMLGSNENHHEILRFGSGRLLADLLTHAKVPSSENKIIFVGDPAQLPPVGESVSKALDSSFFDELMIGYEEYELTEIIRQRKESTLLANAMKVRDLIFSARRPELQFRWDAEMYPLEPGRVVEHFIRDYPQPSIGSGVIINFKNRDCLDFNHSVREQYFPGKKTIQPGDILMITKNSYQIFGHDLFNGDLARVVEADDDTEIQAANVYVDEGGKRVQQRFRFRFRNVVLKLLHIEPVIPVKIIDSMLDQPESGLSVHEMRALFINFNYRFNNEQDRRKRSGLQVYDNKSKEFKEMLRADPYYNAIHVKYGYSVTCHKAQGGEWDKVYVNFSGRSGLKTDQLRWSYTAITRAKNELAAIHPPFVTILGAITFATVSGLTKIPAEAITFGEYPQTPWHGSHSHPAKIELYHLVTARLTGTPFEISRIDSSDYLDSYYIRHEEQVIRCDAGHNAAGIFRPFQTNNTDELAIELCELLNKTYEKSYRLNYSPGAPHYQKLFGKMRGICSELEIQIMSVIEQPDNYFVTYYLALGGKDIASIQFYCNKELRFTRAIPKITDRSKSGILDTIRDQFT